MTRLPHGLPMPDARRSPHTGWTRTHWEAVADHLLTSVVPYATDDFAQFRLPGRASWSGQVSDGLEGFARTFLLAAFRIAGAGGDVPPALLERYAQGLVAGTDPAHPFAWPALTDMSQQLAEAASVALALHETRPWLFDRLTSAEQERVVAWLAGAVGKRTPDNNWVLFRVVVEQFLASVGGPHEPDEITGGLERIEEWYVGNGWYSDGKGKNFDYYCGWAMHQYPSLWARMAGDKVRQELYAGRLRRFLEQYQHFFAADGGPVHQGRSLTYRFAAVAPFWLGALTGASPLPPGRTRRIAGGGLRHFVERGAPDERGLLTLGWYDEFLPTVQAYSGPASPYWQARRSSACSCRPTIPSGQTRRRRRRSTWRTRSCRCPRPAGCCTAPGRTVSSACSTTAATATASRPWTARQTRTTSSSPTPATPDRSSTGRRPVWTITSPSSHPTAPPPRVAASSR